jgi:hypothetical protein
MANEVTKIELFGANNDGQPVRYAVNSGSSYTKGTLMFISGTGRLMISSDGGVNGLPVAGVLAADASGASYASVWTQGVFEFTASGAIVGGDPVIAIGSKNIVVTNVVAGSYVGRPGTFGYAMNTVADTERFGVRVNL